MLRLSLQGVRVLFRRQFLNRVFPLKKVKRSSVVWRPQPPLMLRYRTAVSRASSHWRSAVFLSTTGRTCIVPLPGTPICTNSSPLRVSPSASSSSTANWRNSRASSGWIMRRLRMRWPSMFVGTPNASRTIKGWRGRLLANTLDGDFGIKRHEGQSARVALTNGIARRRFKHTDTSPSADILLESSKLLRKDDVPVLDTTLAERFED